MDALLVRIGERRLAVPSAQIREVVHALQVTPVPTAPPKLAGLIQLRGQILPVLDLTGATGRHRPTDPLVVVEVERVRAALLVDQLIGVEAESGAEALLDLEAVFSELRSELRLGG